MTGTVLIVEDEEKLAAVLGEYLQRDGFGSRWISEGTAVVESVRRDPPSLILLDLMLPGRDGLSICREIRSFSDIPIIMVTARAEEVDRLVGLEMGADDYICKPFSPREVVARVKSVLRRTPAPPSAAAAGLHLDPATYSATLHGHDLNLTAVEFHLLQFLCMNPRRIFTRSQLIDSIYRDQRVVSDRTIDSHIKKLRKKIASVSPEEELIHSVYGVGYKFEAEGERHEP